EVPEVVGVVIGTEVPDRPHADPETVGEIQVHFRADLQAEPLDLRPEMEVIDQVVPGESVPPEDELRFLRGRLEVLRLLGVAPRGRSEKRGCEDCGQEVGGGGPPQSEIQNLKPEIGGYAVTRVSAS